MTIGLTRQWAGRVLFWALVLCIAVYTVFPFYWAIISSVKPRNELFSTPVVYWPSRCNLETYRSVFTERRFGRNILNSGIVAGGTAAASLVIGSLAAYALGRLPFKGKNFVLYTVLTMTMFPQISILGGLFLLIRAIGLYNTWWGLILSYSTFTLPFTVWVLAAFFRELPAELEQAALVDGATPIQTFRLVLLPLAAPALVTTGLLAFIAAWNEFIFALTFTVNDSARTVPAAIAFFSGSTHYEIPWGEIMAASVIVTLPLIVLVFVFQRRIVEGLTAGAIKG
ncbi:MAG: carbohydrate ABC transporter permease [Bacillota bacterium]